MAEKSLWAYLKKGMQPHWEHARRHEDLLGQGIADVSYYHQGNNWIELKEVKELPKREGTGISLGQWHKNGGAQRHFLLKRRGFLLIRVNSPDRTYLLFNHLRLPPVDTKWTWSQYAINATAIWEYQINFESLAMLLEGKG